MKFLNLFRSSEVAAMETMETRAASPSHCLIKIESYSLLNHNYETDEFVAGEYKWKLIIYPCGDENVKDRDHISVHLAMAETSSLAPNWEVDASFSIFLFNKISGNYLYSPGTTRCFRAVKSEWGISEFISKKALCDPSNGYLINDNCVFGAEVFIVRRQAIIERLSLKNANNLICKRGFKISEFSKLKGSWSSEEFHAGGHKWRINLYPKGNGEGTDHWVSVFLQYVDSKRVEACFTIRMKSQVSDEHHVAGKSTNWFSSPSINKTNPWGWPRFIKIDGINDPNKGFIVKDCCLLDIEITIRAVSSLSI